MQTANRLHDRDNSGTINFTEFTTLNHFIMSLQQKFQQYDTSRKGRIEKKEVEQLLQSMGTLSCMKRSFLLTSQPAVTVISHQKDYFYELNDVLVCNCRLPFGWTCI